MVQRSRQLARMLKVQQDLRKEAEAHLSSLNARRDQLLAVEASIFETMASEDPMQRALASLANDRLRWLDREMQATERERVEVEARWRGYAQRSLVAERLFKAAGQTEQREGERKQLEDLLADVESRRASLP